jgi:hypothetical protein
LAARSAPRESSRRRRAHSGGKASPVAPRSCCVRSPLRLDLDGRQTGRRVGVDQRERLVRGLNQLHRAHDDALESGCDATVRAPPRARSRRRAVAAWMRPGCSARGDL